MCVDLRCLRRERTLFWYGVVGHEHWEKERGMACWSGDLLHSYYMHEIYIYNASIARPKVERTAQDLKNHGQIAHVMHGRTWQVSFA